MSRLKSAFVPLDLSHMPRLNGMEKMCSPPSLILLSSAMRRAKGLAYTLPPAAAAGAGAGAAGAAAGAGAAAAGAAGASAAGAAAAVPHNTVYHN